jgi:hypothetical protein
LLLRFYWAVGSQLALVLGFIFLIFFCVECVYTLQEKDGRRRKKMGTAVKVNITPVPVIFLTFLQYPPRDEAAELRIRGFRLMDLPLELRSAILEYSGKAIRAFEKCAMALTVLLHAIQLTFLCR